MCQIHLSCLHFFLPSSKFGRTCRLNSTQSHVFQFEPPTAPHAVANHRRCSTPPRACHHGESRAMIFFGARLCLLLISPRDAEPATSHRRPVPSACSHRPSAPLSGQKLHRAQRNNAGTTPLIPLPPLSTASAHTAPLVSL